MLKCCPNRGGLRAMLLSSFLRIAPASVDMWSQGIIQSSLTTAGVFDLVMTMIQALLIVPCTYLTVQCIPWPDPCGLWNGWANFLLSKTRTLEELMGAVIKKKLCILPCIFWHATETLCNLREITKLISWVLCGSCALHFERCMDLPCSSPEETRAVFSDPYFWSIIPLIKLQHCNALVFCLS